MYIHVHVYETGVKYSVHVYRCCASSGQFYLKTLNAKQAKVVVNGLRGLHMLWFLHGLYRTIKVILKLQPDLVHTTKKEWKVTNKREYIQTFGMKECNAQSYLCSRSSCSKNDLITGTASLPVLEVKVNFLVPCCSVKTMSNNDVINAGSGGVAPPKHRLETSSIKNDLHCMWNCFFISELQINNNKIILVHCMDHSSHLICLFLGCSFTVLLSRFCTFATVSCLVKSEYFSAC